MEESKKNKKVERLIADLKSEKQQIVLNALTALHAEGDQSVLEPVLSLLLSTKDDKIKLAIINLFSDLKDSTVIEPMIQILKSESYRSIRQDLLATIWNSPLDYSYYLPEFVELAAEGSFMEALECLTIIENLEGPFEERHVLEAQLHLKDYVESNPPKDDQKAKIMSEIALLIKDLNDMDFDDIALFNE